MITKENVKRFISPISLTKSKEATLILLFSVLTFLSAQIIIPTQPVPFTLQTMIVLLSGAFLGARNGAYSQILYIISGAIGIPVFAGFSFGFMKLFGPTGGYLLAFPFAAFLAGYLLERNSGLLKVFITFLLADAMIILSGALYLSIFFGGNLRTALFSGAILFTLWDILKVVGATLLFFTLKKK
ncbi:biotin transporter BioY [Melioribacter sp. OK-6-Me]|uniref:biotin transporter BioY n=1 Tax=unclassified Melioribacter TaxID=2627329 RepID=UPI003EDADD29